MNSSLVLEIYKNLESEYKNLGTKLIYSSSYELLVAVVLSAQCTDDRVNKVTSVLFKDYNTPQKMLTLSFEELSKIVFPCGLYNNKAKNILKLSKELIDNFNGQVPNNLKDLQSLSGVGRKTADVIIAVYFNGNAIPVDTHVYRVARRIGLSSGNTPLKVEQDLMKIIDENKWSTAHHLFLWHGRKVCKARKPDCENCKINKYCLKKGV